MNVENRDVKVVLSGVKWSKEWSPPDHVYG